MIIKLNQGGKIKKVHLEYPGSYWAAINQTTTQQRVKINSLYEEDLFSLLRTKFTRVLNKELFHE